MRWQHRSDSVVEAGSDAGSNCQLIAYDDSGVAIDSVVDIDRVSTGAISLNRDVAISGTITAGSGTHVLTNAAGLIDGAKIQDGTVDDDSLDAADDYNFNSVAVGGGAGSTGIDLNADGSFNFDAGGTFGANIETTAVTNAALEVKVSNSGTGTSSSANVISFSDSADTRIISHALARTISRYGETMGGWSELFSNDSLGLAIGTFDAVPVVIGTDATAVIKIDGTSQVINLSGVPTSAAGLSSGDVWANSNVLTLVP
jgi:hypothetical protein